jgi:hypothetical protein
MPVALEEDCTGSLGMLYLAFDLGEVYWTLGFTVELGQRPREVRILSGNMVRLEREIAEAKGCFGLPDDAVVASCFERSGRSKFVQKVRPGTVRSPELPRPCCNA